ncbi:low affinity Fe/Cu permease [Mycoplana sp. BE70]|uniref:low affinity iron permease family protein n=1 Tax=Mycoplana sp. BE70 TaxID=2817775 RepID=UPI0028559817|nr:low affinity iron permease family protein [Mycoplana sp. BE70]MDR6759520.1 low affinity Fe/Cu permease [Mycoplana sp. BE70]
MPGLRHLFTAFANRVSDLSGKPVTFMLAFAGVVAWAVTGPMFGYSETWQLVINTSTTIITFLMVFILQNTQNRDGKAVQAKLDELILTSKAAENCFVGVERLEEKELRNLSGALADRAQRMETGQPVEPIDISEALKDRPEPPPGNPRKPNGMPIGEG